MSKQKTNKSLIKRVKLTSSGKMTRRHQFAAGHKKSNKSNGALNSSKKSVSIFDGVIKKYKRMAGV
jgi:ribosomal protein L35